MPTRNYCNKLNKSCDQASAITAWLRQSGKPLPFSSNQSPSSKSTKARWSHSLSYICTIYLKVVHYDPFPCDFVVDFCTFSCCRWRPSWKLCREKNLHSSFGQGLLTSILDFPDNLRKINVVLLQQWPWGWDCTLNYITQTADQQRWRQWRLEAASQLEMRWSRDHSIAGRISIHHRNQDKIEF